MFCIVCSPGWAIGQIQFAVSIPSRTWQMTGCGSAWKERSFFFFNQLGYHCVWHQKRCDWIHYVDKLRKEEVFWWRGAPQEAARTASLQLSKYLLDGMNSILIKYSLSECFWQVTHQNETEYCGPSLKVICLLVVTCRPHSSARVTYSLFGLNNFHSPE